MGYRSLPPPAAAAPLYGPKADRSAALAYVLKNGWEPNGHPLSIAEAAVQGLGGAFDGYLAGQVGNADDAKTAERNKALADILFGDAAADDPRRARFAEAMGAGIVGPDVFGPQIADKLGVGAKPEPIKLGKGDSLIDPTDYHPLYTSPDAGNADPFTLGEGQTRFSPDGKTIAAVPKPPDALKPTGDIQDYEYAKSNGYTGSFTDFVTSTKRAGATTINTGPTGIDYGDPETGYAWARNPDGSVATQPDPATKLLRPVQVPIGGGSVDAKAAAAQAQVDAGNVQSATYADVVTEDIGRAVEKISSAKIPVTGIGSVAAAVPGSDARDVASLINTIKANVGFDRLQQMRASSPTGGALGAVSDFENQLLQATVGSLDQSQSQEQLVYNLQRVKKIYEAIITRGIKPGDPIVTEMGGNQPPNDPTSAPQATPDSVIDYRDFIK